MPARALLLLPFAAVLCLYGNTLANAFWETDAHLYHLLSEQALEDLSPSALERVYGFVLHSPKGWADIGTFATWLGIFALAGPWVVPFHIAVVTLHGLTSVLLVQFVRGAGATWRQALATGLLFAATPLVEEVPSVPAKLEYALFAVLALAAMLALRRWCGRGGPGWLGLALGCTAGAALTKEFVILLPWLALLEIRVPASGEAGPTLGPSPGRRVAALVLITMLSLPTFVRPVVLSLAPAPATTATAPADVAMGEDLSEYLRPTHFFPKMLGDLARFGLVPFPSDGSAEATFPFVAAGMGLLLVVASAGRRRAGAPRRRLLLGALGWIAVGYGLVGFHISRESFEKTGELYVAVIGISLLLGELFAGGRSVGRARTIALATLLVAMSLQTLSLHRLSRVHGERVARATAALEATLSTTGPGESIVFLGEGYLDRGAIDAVVLAVALSREDPLPSIHLVNGTHRSRREGRCPDGGLEITAPGTRVLRWDEKHRDLFEISDRREIVAALRWSNPDPEENHTGIACARDDEAWQVIDTDLLRDLAPSTILPRL